MSPTTAISIRLLPDKRRLVAAQFGCACAGATLKTGARVCNPKPAHFSQALIDCVVSVTALAIPTGAAWRCCGSACPGTQPYLMFSESHSNGMQRRFQGRVMRGFSRALWIAVCALVAAPALAADLPTRKPAPEPIPEPALPSTWRFEITGYGWATNVAGNIGFGPLPTLAYYAPFAKIAGASRGRVHGQR